ncbi:unnamed protein product [Alopecurus aequalis]
MPVDLSMWVLACFDPIRRELIIPGRGTIRVHADNYQRNFGLRNEGNHVPFELDGEAISFMNEEYAIEDAMAPTFKDWCEMIRRMGGVADMKFLRAYFAAVISCFMCPTTKCTITPRCYGAIKNMEQARGSNFSQLAIDQIITEVKGMGSKKNSGTYALSRRLGTFVEEYGRLNEDEPSTTNPENTRNKRQKVNIDEEADEFEDEEEDEESFDEADYAEDDVDSDIDKDEDEGPNDEGPNTSGGNDTRDTCNESNGEGHSRGSGDLEHRPRRSARLAKNSPSKDHSQGSSHAMSHVAGSEGHQTRKAASSAKDSLMKYCLEGTSRVFSEDATSCHDTATDSWCDGDLTLRYMLRSTRRNLSKDQTTIQSNTADSGANAATAKSPFSKLKEYMHSDKGRDKSDTQLKYMEPPEFCDTPPKVYAQRVFMEVVERQCRSPLTSPEFHRFNNDHAVKKVTEECFQVDKRTISGDSTSHGRKRKKQLAHHDKPSASTSPSEKGVRIAEEARKETGGASDAVTEVTQKTTDHLPAQDSIHAPDKGQEATTSTVPKQIPPTRADSTNKLLKASRVTVVPPRADAVREVIKQQTVTATTTRANATGAVQKPPTATATITRANATEAVQKPPTATATTTRANATGAVQKPPTAPHSYATRAVQKPTTATAGPPGPYATRAVLKPAAAASPRKKAKLQVPKILVPKQATKNIQRATNRLEDATMPILKTSVREGNTDGSTTHAGSNTHPAEATEGRVEQESSNNSPKVQAPATIVQKSATKVVHVVAANRQGISDTSLALQPDAKVNQGATATGKNATLILKDTTCETRTRATAAKQVNANIPQKQIQEPGQRSKTIFQTKTPVQVEPTSATRITCPPPAPRPNEVRGVGYCDAPSFSLGFDSPEKEIRNSQQETMSSLSTIKPIDLNAKRFDDDDMWSPEMIQQACAVCNQVEMEKGYTRNKTPPQKAENPPPPTVGFETSVRVGKQVAMSADASPSTTAPPAAAPPERRIVRQPAARRSPYVDYSNKITFYCSAEVKQVYDAVIAHGRRYGRGQTIDKTPVIVQYPKFFVTLQQLQTQCCPTRARRTVLLS